MNCKRGFLQNLCFYVTINLKWHFQKSIGGNEVHGNLQQNGDSTTMKEDLLNKRR